MHNYSKWIYPVVTWILPTLSFGHYPIGFPGCDIGSPIGGRPLPIGVYCMHKVSNSKLLTNPSICYLDQHPLVFFQYFMKDNKALMCT